MVWFIRKLNIQNTFSKNERRGKERPPCPFSVPPAAERGAAHSPRSRRWSAARPQMTPSLASHWSAFRPSCEEPRCSCERRADDPRAMRGRLGRRGSVSMARADAAGAHRAPTRAPRRLRRDHSADRSWPGSPTAELHHLPRISRTVSVSPNTSSTSPVKHIKIFFSACNFLRQRS